MAGKRHSREGPFLGNGMWLKAAEKSAKKSSIFRKCGNPSNLVWVLQSSNTTSLFSCHCIISTVKKYALYLCVCICNSGVFVSVFAMTRLHYHPFCQCHGQEYLQKEREVFVKTWISNNHKQRPSSSWSKSSNTTVCIFQNYMRQKEDYSATMVHKLKNAQNIPIFIQGDFLTGFAPPFSVLK